MLDQKMFMMYLIIHTKIVIGNPTNGATTGTHLHFTIKKDGQAVNPLDYF